MRPTYTLAFFAFASFFLGVIALSVMPLGLVSVLGLVVGPLSQDVETKIAQALAVLTVLAPGYFILAVVVSIFDERSQTQP